MSRYVSSSHKALDFRVPVLTFALNTSVQGTAKFSPLQLVYGREPNSPRDVRLGFDGFELADVNGDYAKQLFECAKQA